MTYAVTQGPTLGWMLYGYHLEILNSFCTGKINFHFALGPANYAASPVPGSRDLAQFGLCSHWRQLSEFQRHCIACVYLHVGLHPQPGDYKRSGGVLSTQHRAWHRRDAQEMFIEQTDWKTNRLLIQLYKRNIQKPQLNRAKRPEGGALMPCNDSRAQKEEERLFFPGTKSANEKPQTLCL